VVGVIGHYIAPMIAVAPHVLANMAWQAGLLYVWLTPPTRERVA